MDNEATSRDLKSSHRSAQFSGRKKNYRFRYGLVSVILVVASAVALLLGVAPAVQGEAVPRVAWYLKSGQWHADMRTMGSVLGYVLARTGSNVESQAAAL